jgi:uncharacterized glyoxalase superfamily protein PhnB
MVIEHIAFQPPSPAAAADWYEQHLGFTVARASSGPSRAQFIADSAGRTVLEIYDNATASMPDYYAQSPLTLHIAFISEDIAADIRRLHDVGATIEEHPKTTPDGDTLAMMRDPWGIPLQLVHRAKPLL